VVKSPRSEMGRRWHVFATLTAAGAACWGGCSLDARQLTVHDAGGDPLPLVIATFEHGTGNPDDPRFEPFKFYAYGEGPGSALNSPLVSGHNSNFAVGLNWVVFDPVNGHPDYPGVGVRTQISGGIDLSAYSRIVFALKYAAQPAGFGFPDASACSPVTALTVSVGCSERHTSFEKNMPMSPTGRRSPRRSPISGSRATCRRRGRPSSSASRSWTAFSSRRR